MKLKSIKLNTAIESILPLAALLIGLLLMVLRPSNVSQASLPSPMRQSFVGEYSWDKENWFELDDQVFLSAFDGDLYLRGHWEKDMPSDTRMYFFGNHIGGELYIDGQLHMMDIIVELEKYNVDTQPSMCRRSWQYTFFPDGIDNDALVEIRLTNPHSFGNKMAYMDFLSSMYCTGNSPELVEKCFESDGNLSVGIGIVFALVSVMLLGAALASFFMRVPIAGMLSKFGLLTMFAGGYYVFDAVNVSFWSENNVLNTYANQVCMMYAVYMLGVLAKELFSGRAKKLAAVALNISAIINSTIVLLSFAGLMLIFDTLVFWVASQLLLCTVLIYCCIRALPELPPGKRPTLFFFAAIFAAILLDIVWNSGSYGVSGKISKVVFVVFFAFVFVRSAGNIIADYTASVRAKKLEKELEESRISVMLSQVQPHFLFNVLGTLRGLCREDPEQAWNGLGDFSTYLRGNMNALTNTKSIPFETELRHVETYLRLEKMRLGNKLSIIYDIEEKDFSIPPLTLQPLVENAVKHGLFYKESGGTVIIHSRQEKDRITISVQDDGVGFEAAKSQQSYEQHSHVGLENVRRRVEAMLGGTLSIESSPEKGTTVTVEFPAPKNQQEGE